MARLNEPSAPTESLESLKRKFMRQNRDIARANSTQSLRIRNLENETSRLLAENLGLREQIIQLQHELEHGRAQRIAVETSFIKTKLEAKLLEVHSLIISLGEGVKPKKKSLREGKITSASPGRSPDQRNWKNMCTLSEAVASQEGRLPPILENKTYPRRTLENQELMNLVSEAVVDTTDSPEIGPPPVSQFVDEDPVKIDLPTRLKNDEHGDLSGLDPPLSVNLEQRRRRRDSSSSSGWRRTSQVDSTPGAKESTISLKTGAKRKLSSREDEEHEIITKSTETSVDEFKFTHVASEEKARHKQVPQPEKSSSRVARELAVARGAPREKLSTAAPASRKVLAPKSVNNSPKKIAKTPICDEVKAAKADILKASSVQQKARETKHETVLIKPSPQTAPLRTTKDQPEPETPAGLGLFLPTSSQPSTERNESRDTPPPPDIGLSTEGLRPSRRARGAVSYAEPNLRDKMRRPTKDLVDAVVPGLHQAHRTSIIKIEEDDHATPLIVKTEPDADDAWKRMPMLSSATAENSPSSSKATVPELSSSNITANRKRRESVLAETGVPRNGSASAVAALLAGNRPAKAELSEMTLEDKSVAPKGSTSYDIYDFRGSSPLFVETAPLEAAQEEKPASRFSRRHSSLSRGIHSGYDSENSDAEGSRKSDLSRSRRRQSSLGLRGSSSASNEPKEEEAEKILRKASSTISMSDLGSSEARSDRSSARRRSMML